MKNRSFTGDFDAPVFSHRDMIGFTSVALSTYRSWQKLGHVSFGIRRNATRFDYSAKDLIMIRAINQLAIWNSLPVAKAAQAVSLASDWIDSNLCAKDLLSAEATLLVFEDDRPALAETFAELKNIMFSSGKPLVVMPLGSFLSECLNDLEHGQVSESLAATSPALRAGRPLDI